jgi:hypothetical protein
MDGGSFPSRPGGRSIAPRVIQGDALLRRTEVLKPTPSPIAPARFRP